MECGPLQSLSLRVINSGRRMRASGRRRNPNRFAPGNQAGVARRSGGLFALNPTGQSRPDFGRPAPRFVFPPRRLNLWAVGIGDYRDHSLFSKAVCSNILIGGADMKVQTLPLDALQTL